MGSDPHGVRPQPDGESPNLYALVIYVPEPLGRFLDELRLKLIPGCNPHAHISVLPPRPLPVAPQTTIEEARGIVAGFPPFDIELGHIEVFPVTDVIYIRVEGGTPQLQQMHRALNQGALACKEPFPYHPHLTLAQEVEFGQVVPLFKRASDLWREFRGRRTFRAEHAVFVQNTRGNQWVDLAEGTLRAVPVI